MDQVLNEMKAEGVGSKSFLLASQYRGLLIDQIDYKNDLGIFIHRAVELVAGNRYVNCCTFYLIFY